MEEILVYFSLKYQGDFMKILEALQKKEIVTKEERKKALESVECCYTTIISEDYPYALQDIKCPPFVLFYKGNLELLNNDLVNIVNDGIGCETNQTLIDSIQQNGLVISEYPGKKKKTKKSSMFSRRLSTGLSSKVIVTQSGIKSESMVSASYALEAYKDVYVFPEAYDSKFKGNNKLIKEGANIITNMEDLVDN